MPTLINSYNFKDPDAQAFINAAAISNVVQQNAINQLVLSLKEKSLWTKFYVVYPFVGGTSSSHKFNLKNPADTDAAFRISFSAGWTHSSNGILPNGSAFADTFLKPSVSFTNFSTHMSVYSRTTGINGSTFSDIGVTHTAATAYEPLITLRVRNANLAESYLYSYIAPNRAAFATNTDGKGFYIGNRTSNVINQIWKNGTKLATNTTTETLDTTVITKNCYLGALNLDGTASQFATNELAFATLGTGLTDQNATDLSTIIEVFQKALNRNV